MIVCLSVCLFDLAGWWTGGVVGGLEQNKGGGGSSSGDGGGGDGGGGRCRVLYMINSWSLRTGHGKGGREEGRRERRLKRRD